MDAQHTMMALRAHKRGGPERLDYEESPRPVPGEGEISVAVRAAAVTAAELTWPETWESGGEDRTPIVPSHEFAGIVAELGPGTHDISVGDTVFGLVPFDRDGAAAEYVVLPAECVAGLADNVSLVEAAAAVLPALTAREALVDHADVHPDQRVLIRGGTGAVGAFLTQFAHAAGAAVTSTVSSASQEAHARALGAEVVVVVARDEEPTGLEGYDVAIDAVGGNVPEWMYASVRREGRLIVLQEPPDQERARRYGIAATFFVVSTRRDRLEELAADLAADRLEVAVGPTFPLSAGRSAYETALSPGRPPGKIVILVS